MDSLLTKSWAVNKASGSTIALSLDRDSAFQGEYAMKFDYDETTDGWAGATITKEVDWSGCDALRFYTIPDGKVQKVVVQLTANDTCYEVYLNEYADYAAAKAGEKLLVTIPFAEFCQRDTPGNPKGGLTADCNRVTSFGLWVNAIGDSAAISDGRVSGTLYYDQITAISGGPAAVTVTGVQEETPSVTRGELWQLIAERTGVEPEGARAWVMEQGISDGYAPERNVSREEFVTMLWRHAGSPVSAGSLDAYDDSNTVKEWAKTAMAWALETGALPLEDGRLSAEADALRTQVLNALNAS